MVCVSVLVSSTLIVNAGSTVCVCVCDFGRQHAVFGMILCFTQAATLDRILLAALKRSLDELSQAQNCCMQDQAAALCLWTQSCY